MNGCAIPLCWPLMAPVCGNVLNVGLLPEIAEMKSQFKPTKWQMTSMRFLARSFPVAWIPYELESFSPEYPEIISAKKLVPALRSLYAKGIAKPYPKLGKWACVMTISGMKAFEEATGQQGLLERKKSAWLFDMRSCYPTEEDAIQSWLKTPGLTE